MKSIKYLLALVVGVISTTLAFAQVPSTPNPAYNQDIGTIITNTLRTAGTVNSSAQNNLNWTGVTCQLVQTASSGAPSTTFSIQNYDAASNSYYTVATSAALTTGPVQGLTVRPSAITGDAIGATQTIKGVPLTRTWRVSQTVAGSSGPATTGKLSCNYLR